MARFTVAPLMFEQLVIVRWTTINTTTTRITSDTIFFLRTATVDAYITITTVTHSATAVSETFGSSGCGNES